MNILYFINFTSHTDKTTQSNYSAVRSMKGKHMSNITFHSFCTHQGVAQTSIYLFGLAQLGLTRCFLISTIPQKRLH